MPKTAVIVTPAAGDGVTVAFTLASGVVNEDVYVDRIHQKPTTDYSIATTTLTFVVAPPAAALIEIYGDPVGVLAAAGRVASQTGFATAKTIINRTAIQCGLAAVADPVASTDTNFIQLVELLNMVGGELLQEHEWTQQIVETTISTANAATQYALPVDWDRMLNQTHWNRSTRFVMIGPLSGQEVQYLKARLAGVLVQVAYRIQGNVITFPVAPANSQVLAYEYISNLWVWQAGQASPNQSSILASTDIVLYDPELAISWLRHAFREAKGFDTTAERERRQTLLEAVIAKNVGSKILDLGGIGFNADHLIDAANLPITGYGQ